MRTETSERSRWRGKSAIHPAPRCWRVTPGLMCHSRWVLLAQRTGTVKGSMVWSRNQLSMSWWTHSRAGSMLKVQIFLAKSNFWLYSPPRQESSGCLCKTPFRSQRYSLLIFWHPNRSTIDIWEVYLKLEFETARMSFLTLGIRKVLLANGRGNGCSRNSLIRESSGAIGICITTDKMSPLKKCEASSWNNLDGLSNRRWKPMACDRRFAPLNSKLSDLSSRKSTDKRRCCSCCMSRSCLTIRLSSCRT